MEKYELADFKKSAQPFERYLETIPFQNDYHGTDDDMPDAFDAWIVDLEPEEMLKHANAFSKMLLELIN